MMVRPPSESENPIRIYLREIGEVPLISPPQEAELARIIRRGRAAELKLRKLAAPSRKRPGARAKQSKPETPATRQLREQVRAGEDARAQMIKANLRLVVKIAQDYVNYGLPLLDLISEGNIGLMKAVERFEPTKGAKLSTYAAWWIKQSVKRALANQSKTIRLPVHLTDKIARMRRIATQLAEEFGREPTDEELGEELHLAPSKIAQLRTAAIRPASLNATVGDEDGAELGELVGDASALSPAELVQHEDITLEMVGLLDILDHRERTILNARFGLDGSQPLTLEEVGEKFRVTRERIRQIQNLALKKLRRALDKKDKRREIP
jgi:RNA polymerase primary sigma factor